MIFSVFNEVEHIFLQRPCDKVQTGDRINTTIIKMIAEMEASIIPAAGIAAPQVGENKQIFIIKDGKNHEVFINPVVTWRSREKIKRTERCLSVPGFKVRVERFKEVIINYKSERGEKITKKFTGNKAQIVQHELDHLLGKTINNRGVLVKDI